MIHDVLAILAAKKGWIYMLPFFATIKGEKERDADEVPLPRIQFDGQRLVETFIIALIPVAVMWGMMQSRLDAQEKALDAMVSKMETLTLSMHKLELQLNNGTDKATVHELQKAVADFDKRLYLLEQQGVKK